MSKASYSMSKANYSMSKAKSEKQLAAKKKSSQSIKVSSRTRGLKLFEYKQQLKLTQRQKEIAIGVMLGDASLQTQNKGKTFRLQFQGSVKHLEYGRALHKEFASFCLSQDVRIFRRRSRKTRSGARFPHQSGGSSFAQQTGGLRAAQSTPFDCETGAKRERSSRFAPVSAQSPSRVTGSNCYSGEPNLTIKPIAQHATSPSTIREVAECEAKWIESWDFKTISHEEFNSLASIFYGGLPTIAHDCAQSTTQSPTQKMGKKRILPNPVEKHLTPLGLAYWFMDDGSKMDHTKNKGKGIQLHTQGFEEHEVQYLCEGLNKKFNLICWMGKNKGKNIINISGHSYEKFVELVQTYILPSMEYKIPTKRADCATNHPKRRSRLSSCFRLDPRSSPNQN